MVLVGLRARIVPERLTREAKMKWLLPKLLWVLISMLVSLAGLVKPMLLLVGFSIRVELTFLLLAIRIAVLRAYPIVGMVNATNITALNPMPTLPTIGASVSASAAMTTSGCMSTTSSRLISAVRTWLPLVTWTWITLRALAASWFRGSSTISTSSSVTAVPP